MTRPLDPVERALLGQLGADPTDDHARRVLADHWLSGVDEPRGTLVQEQCAGLDGRTLIAMHGACWRRTAMAAGFPEDLLELRRGFAAAALALDEDDPLLASPDALRLSPRQYVLGHELDADSSHRTFEVVARTATGDAGRYVMQTSQVRAPPSRSLERLAVILGRLDHPNTSRLVGMAIHRAHGFGVVVPWAGVALSSRPSPWPPDEALAIALGRPLCDALIALAAQEIVHGFIEPRTVMIREDGHVTLIGFAEASVPGVPELDQAIALRRGVRFRHLSREQASGQYLTAATDVFSLAVLLATLALGRHPLRHGPSDYNLIEAIRAHAYDLPGDTPLMRLLRTVIVPDPAARPTARELAAALRALR